MTGIAKAHVVVLSLAGAMAACATPAARQTSSSDVVTVNPDFRLDAAKAEAGHDLWGARGCMGCHSIGHGRLAGPDLFGVTERRSIDWLKSFLKDTNAMLNSDPIAMALLEEFRGARMPQVNLNDQEIEAILHYIQRKTNDRRAGK